MVRHVLWDYPVTEGVWLVVAGLLESHVPWLVMNRLDVCVLWALSTSSACPQMEAGLEDSKYHQH